MKQGSWTPSSTKKQLAELTRASGCRGQQSPGGQSPALCAVVKGKGRGSWIKCHPNTASSASTPGKEVGFAKSRSLERSETVQDSMWRKLAICREITEGILLPRSWMVSPQHSPSVCMASTRFVIVLRAGALGLPGFFFVFFK